MNVSTVRIATRVTFRRIARALLNVFTLRNLTIIALAVLAGIGTIIVTIFDAIGDVVKSVGALIAMAALIAIPCGIVYVIFHFIIKYW